MSKQSVNFRFQKPDVKTPKLLQIGNYYAKIKLMRLNDLLKKAEKPARYIGGEYGSGGKEFKEYNYCLCFPDVYEVAMSNLGIRIVEKVMSDVDGVFVDRCFAPWDDFGKLLKENNMPLYGLNSKRPLKDFDAIGFSMGFELCYTSVLYMLDLAGIPLLRKDRDDGYPVIEAGGPCTCNPEPMSDFIDLFILGDGEAVNGKLAKLRLKHKNKTDYLKEASKLCGVYVPSMMDVKYADNGLIEGFSGITEAKKAVVADLDKAVFPKTQPVGNIEVVFDRAVVEVMRGGPRGCRFCQAGYIYRPIRMRSVDTIISQAKSIVESTGFDELSLNSLSTGDYPCLIELLSGLKEALPDTKIALPSLRIDSFDSEFVSESKKNSLTFAPEAGTQRLRDVINKDVTEEQIERCVMAAFSQGYTSIKLYFMIGLPTETDDDLNGICDIVYKIREIYSRNKRASRELRVSVSASTFIPKPFTPFQWERQITEDEFKQKVDLLKQRLFVKGVSLSWNDFAVSKLEAVLARGDRKLGKVILSAYYNGAHLDSWSEYFNKDIWQEAFSENGVDPDFYTRKHEFSEVLPWDFINVYVHKSYLKKEAEKAYEEKVTGSCFKGCKGCGIQKEFRCELC